MENKKEVLRYKTSKDWKLAERVVEACKGLLRLDNEYRRMFKS